MWSKVKSFVASNVIEVILFVFGLLAAIFSVFSANIVFTLLGVGLTVAALLLGFWNSLQKKAEEDIRTNMFKLLDKPHQIGSLQSDLTGLCWNGEHLFLVGRVGEINGLYSINDKFVPTLILESNEGWFWKIAFEKSFFIVRIFEGSKFEILEYTENGDLLKISITPKIEEQEHPGFLISTGKHFWLGFDVVNRIYKLSDKFEVIDHFSTSHRILGAVFANESFWITDGNNIYQYDSEFNFIDKLPYPGTSCRGLAFDNKNMWSIDNGPKRLLKHYFE